MVDNPFLGDAVLIGCHPEDELLEIPPAIFGMAVGDGHLAGGELGVVRAADAERGGIDVEAVRTVIGGEEARRDDLVEELGRAVRGDWVTSQIFCNLPEPCLLA
jgi:hypothetical protein